MGDFKGPGQWRRQAEEARNKVLNAEEKPVVEPSAEELARQKMQKPETPEKGLKP